MTDCLPYLLLSEFYKLLSGSQMITIWGRLKAVCAIVLINCFIIAWIVSTTTFGYSINDTLIDALQFVGLMLPLVNVLLLFYLIYKKKYYDWVIFQTSFFNLIFLLGISVSNSISGFYSKDTVTFAASITMVVLLVVAFISFAILWWKVFWYEDDDTFQRWMSVYNVGFLIVVVIATITWMAFKGLRPEDVGVAITSMVGLVFSAAYAIIFTCWSWKGSPDDKQWWWCLNICNIVALVFILIALICWIVTKGRNEGTNENNRAEIEKDHGEKQELQTLSPGHEAEPENHPAS
ncbi:uncharacterized protein LOC132394811 [Hypanus sabinus]|uniref:uncharacterized protein LOC132394811 n=1 Tax=Hypanus sabinus TaxID=79690 RepID=UPI0028C47BFF|nr:uncharacterized protein LOC132394811 [Hypanus sabinus]